jgi:hypothetical protein
LGSLIWVLIRQAGRKPATPKSPELECWIRGQLEKLADLLKDDPGRVKSEFRRLNLQLKFTPTEAKPRPYFTVAGQCDLIALVFFHLQRLRERKAVKNMIVEAHLSAALDRFRGRSIKGSSHPHRIRSDRRRRSTSTSSKREDSARGGAPQISAMRGFEDAAVSIPKVGSQFRAFTNQ